MDISHVDGLTFHKLISDFEGDASGRTLYQYVFEEAPDPIRDRFFLTKKGEPSSKKAKSVLQTLLGTTVIRVSLRPSYRVARNFIEAYIDGTEYAQNFITGTNRALGWWNHLPEDARKSFLRAYEKTSWDDAIEDRVDAVEASAKKLVDHFKQNPWSAELADLEGKFAEQLEAYNFLVDAYEKNGKKGKRPKRPSNLARETKRLQKKAKKWKYQPELTGRKIGKLIRLHDHMRMLSQWGGSKTGAKAKNPRSYEYTPLTLQYPGAKNKNGASYGWGTFLVCLLDEQNLPRVVRGGERLDRISAVYRQCLAKGVERFTDANQRYLDYLKAKKSGVPSRKVGPPQFKDDVRSTEIQSVSVHVGGPKSLTEGLSADGKHWEVRCNACSRCEDGKLCHKYSPFLRIGGMKMAVGKDVAAKGIRISRAEYRRIKKTCAHGGRLSEVLLVRETQTPRKKGAPEPVRTKKKTRGKVKKRKRTDCDPKTRYFASIVLSDLPVPALKPLKYSRVLGIDPGARKFLTLSDGTVFPDLQAALEPYRRECKRLQRILSRWHDPRCPDKKRGRKYEAIKRAHADASAKLARMRRHLHEQIITDLLEMPYDVYVLEDLSVKNITRSGKGTAAFPAAYGQAKSARERNRKVLAQGINRFINRFIQRAKKCGKVVLLVNPAYTSQTCHPCKERHGELGSSEVFVCPSCGHENDRDHNASLNIRDKGIAILKEHGLPAVGGKYLGTGDAG